MAEGLRPRTGPEHTQFGTSEREKFPSREVDPSRYKNLVYYDLFGERARNSASYSMFSGYEYNKDGWAARIMKDEIKNLIKKVAPRWNDNDAVDFLSRLESLIKISYQKERPIYRQAGINIEEPNLDEQGIENYLTQFKNNNTQLKLKQLFYGNEITNNHVLLFFHNREVLNEIYSTSQHNFLSNLKKAQGQRIVTTDSQGRENIYGMGVRELTYALRYEQTQKKRRSNLTSSQTKTREQAEKELAEKITRSMTNNVNKNLDKLSKRMINLLTGIIHEGLNNYAFRQLREKGMTIEETSQRYTLEEIASSSENIKLTFTQEEFSNMLINAIRNPDNQTKQAFDDMIKTYMTEEQRKGIKQSTIDSKVLKITDMYSALSGDTNYFMCGIGVNTSLEAERLVRSFSNEELSLSYLNTLKDGLKRFKDNVDDKRQIMLNGERKNLKAVAEKAYKTLISSNNLPKMADAMKELLEKNPRYRESVEKLFTYTQGQKLVVHGNIGETLNGIFMKINLKNANIVMTGAETNELGSELAQDIIDTVHGIGYQIKNWSVAFSQFRNMYASDNPISFGDQSSDFLLKYFKKRDLNRLRYIMMNTDYFQVDRAGEGRPTFNIPKELLYPSILYSVPTFLRYYDEQQPEKFKSIQTNIFILNYKIVPSSIIFAEIYRQIIEQEKKMNYVDLFDKFFELQYNIPEQQHIYEHVGKAKKDSWYSHRAVDDNLNLLNDVTLSFKGFTIDLNALFKG